MNSPARTILLAIAVCQFFAAGCARKQDLIQGRPVADWVAEVEIGGFPDRTDRAMEVFNQEGPKAATQLVPFLRHATPDIQAKAAYALSIVCYRNPNAPEVLAAVPDLTVAARSPDREVQIFSIQSLRAIGKGADTAASELILLTKDSDSGVRMSAVEALGQIGSRSPETIAALKAALSDTSSDVRITATNVLAELHLGK